MNNKNEMVPCVKKPGKRRYVWRILSRGLIFALPLLSGCTGEKARQLATAATLFKSNAHDAITAMRGLMDAQIAPTVKTDTQRADQFVSNILSLPVAAPLDSNMMDMAIDPYSIKLSSAEIAARNALLDNLDQEYVAFASMFDDLERGSFLAAKSVAKTKTYAATLTAQMSGIAKVVADNPPELIQQRVAVMTQIQKVRKDQTLTADQKRQQLSDLLNLWLGVKAQEGSLQQGVVSKCLIAASSGQSVLQLADSYDRLSLDDINQLTTGMISLAAQVSGKNLTDLKTQNARIQSFLAANSDYKALADSALEKIQSQLISGAK